VVLGLLARWVRLRHPDLDYWWVPSDEPITKRIRGRGFRLGPSLINAAMMVFFLLPALVVQGIAVALMGGPPGPL
jgi:hypothetical protein